MCAEERRSSREEWINIEVHATSIVPDEVRAVRNKLNMDFGRIDWVMHNGAPVVFDANKTPSGLGTPSEDSFLDIKRGSVILAFSKGIKCFIK